MKKSLRRNCFVYCIEKQPDGTFLFYNRNYQPIGCDTDGSVAQKVNGLGEATLKKLACDGKIYSDDKVYLYNDGCKPESSKDALAAYLEKLTILLKR